MFDRTSIFLVSTILSLHHPGYLSSGAVISSSAAINASASITNSTRSTTFNNGSAATTTDPPPSTTKGLGCFNYLRWKSEAYDTSCLTDICAETMFSELQLYITCNTRFRATEPQYIASFAGKFAHEVAKNMIKQADGSLNNDLVISVAKHRESFFLEYGYIQSAFLEVTDEIVLPSTGYQDEVQVTLPATILRGNQRMAYEIALYIGLQAEDSPVEFYEEWTYLRSALQELESRIGYIRTGNEGRLTLNSQIFEVNLNIDDDEHLQDYIEIQFKLKNFKTTRDHVCMAYVGGDYGNGYWSDKQCRLFDVAMQYVTCRCDRLGIFAISSKVDELKEEEKKLKRTSLSLMLYGVCGLGLLLVCANLALPLALNCLHLSLVKIQFMLNLCLGAEYVVFAFGVLWSDNPSASQNVAAALHVLHHCVIIWVIMEGVHLFNCVRPLYDPEMTSPLFFYSTLGFGIPATFAGAAAGYPVPFQGLSEFTWITATGMEIVYITLPTVVAIVMLIAFDALLLYELASWIGPKTDYFYKRASSFAKRSFGYIFILVVTHVCGILAKQNVDKKIFAYLMMVSFALQGIIAFSTYFINNNEIWEWRNEKPHRSKEYEQNDLERHHAMPLRDLNRSGKVSEAQLKPRLQKNLDKTRNKNQFASLDDNLTKVEAQPSGRP